MNLRGTFLLVLAAALVPAAATSRPLTLDEAETRALDANPRLRAAKFDIAAAKARSAEAIGRHFGEKDLERAAGATDAHARQETRYNVRAAYRNLLVLSHALEAVEAYEKALEEDVRAADLKVKVEAWPPVDAQDQALFDGRAISWRALDLSRAQLEGARAARVSARQALDSARTVRSYADVVSPFDGVVTARLVEPGDLATPGKPLLAIQVLGTVRLLSKLSQDVVARLKAGDEAVFGDGRRTAKGQVTRIYPALDPTHLGVVETVLDAAPFGRPAGATLAVTFVPAPVGGLLVPASALLRSLDRTLVIRVKDGRDEPVPVEVAARSAKDVAVHGGISAGDVVVTGLPSELMSLAASRPAVVTQASAQQ